MLILHIWYAIKLTDLYIQKMQWYYETMQKLTILNAIIREGSFSAIFINSFNPSNTLEVPTTNDL